MRPSGEYTEKRWRRAEGRERPLAKDPLQEAAHAGNMATQLTTVNAEVHAPVP